MSCNVLHHKNQRVFSWFLIIFDDFGHLGTIQSPYKNWLKYRDWVQYERITFRAVPIYCRTALFVNSESDTFLMNYSTFICIVPQYVSRETLNFRKLYKLIIVNIPQFYTLYKNIFLSLLTYKFFRKIYSEECIANTDFRITKSIICRHKKHSLLCILQN